MIPKIPYHQDTKVSRKTTLTCVVSYCSEKINRYHSIQGRIQGGGGGGGAPAARPP